MPVVWLRVDAGRQVGEIQQRTRAERDHAIDAVLKFSNISGPVVAKHGLHSFVSDRVTRLRSPLLRKEALNEHRKVFFSLAKGREDDADDVKPVVQIFSKSPCGNLPLQALMRGRDDPQVHSSHLYRANRQELFLLLDAEKLDLQLEWEVTDFIEECGTAVGKFNEAGPGRPCACESVRGVAEKLSLHQRAHHCTAVDDHESATGT